MTEIGGYFGFELNEGQNSYHDTAYNFKSGRSSLNFILNRVRPAKIYIPFYTCDALLEPIILSKVPFEFYGINEKFEPLHVPVLQDAEYFLAINYFDTKREYITGLSARLGNKLIIDNTQAFFWQPGTTSWAFNSVRKFFGVPDGSYLTVPDSIQISGYEPINANDNYNFQHLLSRFNGKTREGYPFYKENEMRCDSTMLKMSLLTTRLLSHVDYNEAIGKRKQNWNKLHNELATLNRLSLSTADNCVPGYYPFMPISTLSHEQFWEQKIFIPVFWKECLGRPGYDAVFTWEKEISASLLPIPIDHRYSEEDMDYIIEKIRECL